MDFVIKPLTSDDKDEVYEFTKSWFFPTEPLTMNWTDIPSKDDLTYIRAIDHGLGIKAIDNQGNTAAICINGDETQITDNVPPIQHSDLKKLYDFFDTVDSECNKETGLMSVLIVSVADRYRRQGLCTRLLKESFSIAHRNGFSGVRVLCTSKHSASAASKVGWQCLLSKPYSSYVDSEINKPLYSPPNPHTHVSVYQQILNR